MLHIALPTHLTAATIGPVIEDVRLARHQPLAIDASKLTVFNTQGIQFLLACQCDWQVAGAEFSIINPTEQLVAACTRLGLSGKLFPATGAAQ